MSIGNKNNLMESTFANKVLLLRKRMNLSQLEFAKLLGVSRNYLSMIETGREPSDTLKRLFQTVEYQYDANSVSSNRVAEETPIQSELSTLRGRALLKQARQQAGHGVADFAKLLGYPTVSTYQNIEEGGSKMGQKMAERAAKILGLNVADLLDGSDEPPCTDVPFGSFGAVPSIKMGPGMEGVKAKFVPLLSMAQCGVMQAYTDEAYTGEGFLAYSPDPKAFAVKLAGDSMLPRIEPGDVAVVSPSKLPRNGNVVLVRLDEEHGGDVMCKIYHAAGDQVTLSSYNPVFPPLTYSRAACSWVYPVQSVTKVF
ncbi:MAG TPA: S24 family peptidase [Prosthecobacter sp.]